MSPVSFLASEHENYSKLHSKMIIQTKMKRNNNYKGSMQES